MKLGTGIISKSSIGGDGCPPCSSAPLDVDAGLTPVVVVVVVLTGLMLATEDAVAVTRLDDNDAALLVIALGYSFIETVRLANTTRVGSDRVADELLA